MGGLASATDTKAMGRQLFQGDEVLLGPLNSCMVISLSTEKYDDFYQQASSIVGLTAPFPFGMVVGQRASPQPSSPQLCFENMTTSR